MFVQLLPTAQRPCLLWMSLRQGTAQLVSMNVTPRPPRWVLPDVGTVA